MIEFQFYWSVSTAAAASGPGDKVTQTRAFADLYLLLNGAAVLVQLVLAAPLQRLLGVYGSLFILPGALSAVSALVVATSSASSRSLLRVAEGGLKSSIHRSNWEQTYLPVSRAERASVKLLVDGMAARLGEATAAVILLYCLHFLNGSGLGAHVHADVSGSIMLAGSAVWIALTAYLLWRRKDPGLIQVSEEELRPDLPIPDG
jgi:ATP/ADP translocase